jgi:hypothetical protein
MKLLCGVRIAYGFILYEDHRKNKEQYSGDTIVKRYQLTIILGEFQEHPGSTVST